MIHYIIFILIILVGAIFICSQVQCGYRANSAISNSYITYNISGTMLAILISIFILNLAIWGISYGSKNSYYKNVELIIKDEKFELPQNYIDKINNNLRLKKERNKDIFIGCYIPDWIVNLDSIPNSRASDCLSIPAKYVENFVSFEW